MRSSAWTAVPSCHYHLQIETSQIIHVDMLHDVLQAICSTGSILTCWVCQELLTAGRRISFALTDTLANEAQMIWKYLKSQLYIVQSLFEMEMKVYRWITSEIRQNSKVLCYQWQQTWPWREIVFVIWQFGMSF